MQHVERAWLALLALRCSAKLCAVLGLCALLPAGSPWPLHMLGLDVTFCVLFPLIAEQQVRVRLLVPLLLLEVLLAWYAHSAWALVPADNTSMYSSTPCTALQNLVVLVIAVVFERSHRATFLLEQLQPPPRAPPPQQLQWHGFAPLRWLEQEQQRCCTASVNELACSSMRDPIGCMQLK
ncbi:hypothetical protein DUNSADRAFT_16875 [Dunaliella salina]|uniref:Uncharacterized protein n=1 Tax=Dunaliella salina TaxID=3046 RepID=A0ABQ7H948_DUNSA|nr:hypothetical protein DUNSADRAFT_16875 [Dunaliella salina]|eukprot:KAF5843376.1 hypothetical protein DUNSADRAFT_16875 [Dunaliella salina]